MKIRLLLKSILILLSFFVVGCQETGSKEPRSEPVTSFGKAVHSSKDLSHDIDERSEHLDSQAELLEDE